MNDLIQRDPREPFREEPICRHCGQEATSCDCDGYSTSALAEPNPLLAKWIHRGSPRTPGLSFRQRQIAIGLWAGLKRREMAIELKVAGNVIDYHRKVLFARMKVRTRREFLMALSRIAA